MSAAVSSAEDVEPATASHQPMRLTEFVVFASSAMAINALAVSIMLSALPQIAAAYALQNANAQQLVLTIFFVGFSLGQFIVGPISDRFGRRRVLLAGLALYSLASLLCVVAPSFTVLLAARLAQGLASASPRVVITSAVRDCYVGRRMASLMSLVTMVLFIAPVAAPAIGQAILSASNWQVLFVVLLAHGVITLTWALRRFPETQPLARRRPLELASLFDAFRRFLTTRQSALVTLAGGACAGCPLAFLVSSPLVIGTYYGLGQYFTLAFSAIAVTMGLAAFSNSRFVARFGMRRIARWSLLICTLTALGASFAALTGALSFALFMATFFVLNSLLLMNSANFTALALEPHGAIAGTASSLYGGCTTLMSALISSAIGLMYNASPVPLVVGSLLCCATALVLIALVRPAAPPS
jgi:DHA1 family bicyclomycin/chloramphenicol resistance-like MFS transporter